LTHSFLTIVISRRKWLGPCAIGTRSVGNSIAGRARRKEEDMASIKANLGFKKLPATDVLARATAVLGGVFTDKEDYSNPPVDQATLKSQIDALSVAMAASLDGGKQAIAAREHLKEVLIKSLRQLGHYVEENCKDKMETFLKSGFRPAAITRTLTPP